MAKVYSNDKLLSILISYARGYDTYLCNCDFAFAYKRSSQLVYTELSFEPHNFAHLAGIRHCGRIKNPSSLYKMLINGNADVNDFKIIRQDFIMIKLEVLPEILCEDLYARKIGDYDKSLKMLQTDKMIGRYDICIGAKYNEHSGMYSANSLIKDNINKITSRTAKILYTLRKHKTSSQYKECVYCSEDEYYPDLPITI